MFFIVPNKTHQATDDDKAKTTLPAQQAETTKRRKRAVAEPEETASYYPKRNPKACDRCRLKKARCTGGRLCARCRQDGVVCTTTRDSKKPSMPPNPAYVHLVESQRDQLVQALSKILAHENTPDSSKLKQMLTDMGIAAEDIYPPPSTQDSASNDTSSDLIRQALDGWDKVFSDLDDNQIQAIETFCAVTPQTQDMFMSSDINMVPQNALLHQPDAYDERQTSASGEYNDIFFWDQDPAPLDQSLSCSCHDEALGNMRSTPPLGWSTAQYAEPDPSVSGVMGHLPQRRGG